MDTPRQSKPKYFLARDRFSDVEYRIDPKAYYKIMELIRFYHQSMYTLPDHEVIHTQKIEGGGSTSPCDVPVNHLLFR